MDEPVHGNTIGFLNVFLILGDLKSRRSPNRDLLDFPELPVNSIPVQNGEAPRESRQDGPPG